MSPSWSAFINSQSHRHTLLRSRQRNESGGLAILMGSSEGPLSSRQAPSVFSSPFHNCSGLGSFSQRSPSFRGGNFRYREPTSRFGVSTLASNLFNPVKSTFFRDRPRPTGTPYSYCSRDTSAFLPGLGRALPGHPHKSLPLRPDGRGGESP